MRARDMCPYTLEAMAREFDQSHRMLAKYGTPSWMSVELREGTLARTSLYHHLSHVWWRRANLARRVRGLPPACKGCHCKSCASCSCAPVTADPGEEWPVPDPFDGIDIPVTRKAKP